ncbi:MAG: putative DNA binding domain-containing protein [Clostridiales bacterium]|nr:putative DNA binding domain-containing protein [Clostridiales bacterium]
MTKSDSSANVEMLQILHDLILNWENEVVEFKQATNSFSQHEIGQYFSAISNEARLKGIQHGWLVFGVHDRTREIVGTDYRDARGLASLKREIADNTTGRITFTDIFEVYDGGKRVVMFKIPASVTGVPTAWKGHWYGREGESIGALSTEELERLRGQSRSDWSSQLIEDSDISHLDKDAVNIAREDYKMKQNRDHISAEIDAMSDEEFLSKIKLITDGKLTKAAMLLLGDPDYDYLLDTPACVMWRLYGTNDMVTDYAKFKIPYITVVDKVYDKVRNLTYRYIPDRRSLRTVDIPKYDTKLQRELLFNSIAHMDYAQDGRIYIDEYEDYILIRNPGTFLPGDIMTVLRPWYRAPYYRNHLLAEAMTDLNMIDTVAMGIRKVFRIQQERLFPMPDYFFMKPDEVVVRVYGKTLDENYMRMLYDHPEYDIETVYLLDCVQKKQRLSKEQYKHLRSLGAIEGKAPNIHVSLNIAEIIDERVQYTKNKAMDDQYYFDLIINYLQQWGGGKKSDFIALLGDKLSDVLDDRQKENKVKYYLKVLSKKDIIRHTGGNHRTGVWVLGKSDVL